MILYINTADIMTFFQTERVQLIFRLQSILSCLNHYPYHVWSCLYL